LLAAILGLLAGLPARAVDWSKAFGRESLETYLEGESLRILVAAGGESRPVLRSAAGELQKVLRACSKVRMVMSDDALGTLAGLDDRSIVGKAAGLPVDRVAVLRVFPGASAEEPTAVVTFYDREGKTLSAFTVEAGSRLVPRGSSESSGKGVGTRAAETVSKIIEGQKDAGDNAVEEYEKRKIWFADGGVINAATGQLVATWTVPYEGKYKKPIEGAEFYEKVGRPDLASSYRTRTGWRWGLMIAGYGAVLGGMTYGLAVGLSCSKKGEYGICEERNYSAVYIGLAIMGAGSIVGFIGQLFINPHPVSAPEARELADKRNQRLREELGITENRRASGSRASPAGVISLSPYVAPGGGGLLLGVSF
jgi:hypothetical protein